MNHWIKYTLLSFILFIYACNTKVDLVAEGEESPVVYGFINPTVDTQFVKITKSFVTEGSAFEAALDSSLSQYENLEAWIVEWDEGDSIHSYLLKEKIVSNKDSGAFYYPVQKVYYTDEIVFDATSDPKYDYDYEIRFFGSEKNVSSKIAVVGKFKPNNTQAFQTLSLITIFDPSGSSYADKKIDIDQSENTKRYEFTLRYHYLEKYTDGTEQEKYMDFKYATWVTDGLSGQEDHSFFIVGESFFQGVDSRLTVQDNEANVSRRIIGKLDYIFDYAGEDFNIFIELNKPSTSFNAAQNPYTNVTNGIGVWGSRGKTVFSDKVLEVKSIQEMVQGQYTSIYKFCSDNPGHVGLPFYCN